MWFLYGIYISICIFAVCFVMMTVNKLKIIRFMKELVKRLSVPIAEMGACMVMVCLLPSCSVASLFHEEIGGHGLDGGQYKICGKDVFT